jgi:hypothetical protein
MSDNRFTSINRSVNLLDVADEDPAWLCDELSDDEIEVEDAD